MPSHINAYDFIFNVLVKVSCSDLEVVRDANAAVTILNCLLMIVCFVGSIIGCAGACCVQQVRCSNMVMCKNTATPTLITTLVLNNTESRIHVVNPSEATNLKSLPFRALIMMIVIIHLFLLQVPGKRHSMPMTRGYVIPYGNPDNMMMTRIEERRYVDNGPYPTPGRYGWERGYIQEVPGYDRDPVAGYDRDPVPGYERNPVPGYDRDPYYSSARARDDYRAPGHYEEPDEKRYYQEKFYNNENRLARVNDVPDRNKGRNPFAGQTNDTFLY